jgi:hypothetical protein
MQVVFIDGSFVDDDDDDTFDSMVSTLDVWVINGCRMVI